MFLGLRSAFSVVALISVAYGFYLPGVPPEDYQTGALVPMHVDKMTSVKTQLAYDYYSLGFCKPKGDAFVVKGENLGEVLAGDMQESSLYELKMRNDERCKVLCRHTFDKDQVTRLQEFIKDEYRVNWIMDNLPGAVKQPFDGFDFESGVRIERGFSLGFSFPPERPEDKAQYMLYNHIHFKIAYHKDVSFKGGRIVRFELEPYSVKHEYAKWEDKDTKLSTCSDAKPVTHAVPAQTIDAADTEVVFTYDVEWQESDIKWASRWDVYFEDAGPDDQIHWFSIVNSLMIVLFLTGMVAMIMMRTVHRDITAYNEEATAQEVQEETGWKLVHGDVFRPPVVLPSLFAVLVGSGMQILMMTMILMVFALLGFLSPANRGGLITAMLLLFVFMGTFAGYHSSRLYKFFQGKNWKSNTLMTAFLFPGWVYTMVFLMNFFVWGVGSSGAVPFGTLVALLCLWFGISVPLVFLGSYFGFRKEEITTPVRTNQIPRQIPEQAWYLHPIISIAIGGMLPFGAVFIELFFIMSAVWLHQIYYVFGFLVLVLIILLITCGEITVVMCYFQLCSEDYHWWWRSFLTAGSSAFYLYAYAILYFVTKLDMTKFVSGLIYFGYMAIISVAFFLLTGSVGFLVSFWFLRKIYGAIKVE